MEEEKTPKFMIGSNGYYFYYGNRVSQEEYQRLFYMDKVDKMEQTLFEILEKLTKLTKESNETDYLQK